MEKVFSLQDLRLRASPSADSKETLTKEEKKIRNQSIDFQIFNKRGLNYLLRLVERIQQILAQISRFDS
jgi:hypothetical protein